MATDIQAVELSSSHKTCINLKMILYVRYMLTVHLIETKFILMLPSKNTYGWHIQQMICFIILTHRTIDNRDNVMYLSQMSMILFQSKRNMIFFGDH